MAGGPLAQMRGLIGRPQPGKGEGMLLKGKRIHTFGMSYPIDAVYVSGDGEVLMVHTHQANELGPRVAGARWILEMAEGQASSCGIVAGVRLEWER